MCKFAAMKDIGVANKFPKPMIKFFKQMMKLINMLMNRSKYRFDILTEKCLTCCGGVFQKNNLYIAPNIIFI